MWREAPALESRAFPVAVGSARPRSRFVMVRVLDGGREVDGFRASSAETLRDALRPVYRHLTRGREVVQLLGIEEEGLPLGIRRKRRESPLGNLGAAIMFLGG